jgi:predicted secreted hydrolase
MLRISSARPTGSLGAVLALLIGVAGFAETTVEPGEVPSELSILLGSSSGEGYAKAVAPRMFEFPADHGPHPGYRNEWWYLTGNLDDGERRFGYELTIFRFALAPGDSSSVSAWRSNQVYVAHFAITDADRERFYVAERYSRGALGLAGAQADPLRVWIDDWEIAATNPDSPTEHWILHATDDDFALELELIAQKPPVLNGVDGLSVKSAEPGNASYYYSITRWQSAGKLRIGKAEYAVAGLSWLDREWSSSALGADQAGWDWFALQLTDGSELMFYNLRKRNGSQDEHSAGTWVAADGTARHLGRDAVSLTAVDSWVSPEGGEYPATWDIRLPEYGLSLRVTPVMDDQELFTTVRYWEGAVDVVGTVGNKDVTGRGYVELTGYAK